MTTTKLAQFASSLGYADIPPDVADAAALRVLDITGVALRALRDSDSDAAIRSVLRRLHGPGGASALGERDGWSPAHAALLNGTLAHTLDFDDTHEPGSVHPGTVVIPTVLALGEEHAASGRELIAAIVVGYEIVCRVAVALGPRSLYARGFHPTPVAGIVGAAAAAGRLLRLAPTEIEHCHLAADELVPSILDRSRAASRLHEPVPTSSRPHMKAGTFPMWSIGATMPLDSGLTK